MISLREYARVPAELGIPRRQIVQVISDRMYRHIPITDLAYELLLTPQLQHLKGVSHLGLLNGMTRLNTCASRLEHVIGVYYLVLIVTRLPELRPFRNLLIAAALGHDNGSPPYSHSAEGAQLKVLGADHEGVLLLPHYRNSEFAEVLRKWGIDYDEFCLLVQGTHPNPLLNAIINGQHDLDRCDGTCRYALTWHPTEEGLPYDPREIAYSFEVEGDRFVLREQADCRQRLEVVMREFLDTRRAIFDEITSPIIEAPEVQLARAITLAVREGKVKPAFFLTMDDAQATKFLLERCNGATKVLVDRVMRDQHYARFYAKRFPRPSTAQIRLLTDIDNRQSFADHIATELEIPPEDVCVTTGKFKGIVNMGSLLMFDRDGRSIVLPRSETYYLANVYLNPTHSDLEEQVEGVMDEILLLR